jgi:hypothetical protein
MSYFQEFETYKEESNSNFPQGFGAHTYKVISLNSKFLQNFIILNTFTTWLFS